MVVTEMDANQTSTSFSDQFVESLFFNSAWFDCLGDCMGADGANRLDMEINFFSRRVGRTGHSRAWAWGCGDPSSPDLGSSGWS